MALRGILFDLGDTLLDFEPMDARQVFRDGAARIYEQLKPRLPAGLSFDDYCNRQSRSARRTYFISRILGREFDSMRLMTRYHTRLGVELDQPTQHEMMWTWYQAMLAYARIADDVIPTLRTLRERGLKLGLVSNTFIPPCTHDRHLTEAGLIEFFPVRVYSSEVRYRKPHRRIFQIALQRLGTAAHETLFVGDQIKADILGAKRVGMKTALRARGQADHVAEWVIRHLAELVDVVTRVHGSTSSRVIAP
jgi:putative hydrolase of the HAD superfamily